MTVEPATTGQAAVQPEEPPHHDCPGSCGRQVRQDLFACRACWYRLPFEMRRRINETYRRDDAAHVRAMDAARDWFRSHAGVRT